MSKKSGGCRKVNEKTKTTVTLNVTRHNKTSVEALAHDHNIIMSAKFKL